MSLFSITPGRREGAFVSVGRRRDLCIINAQLISVVGDLFHTRESCLGLLFALRGTQDTYALYVSFESHVIPTYFVSLINSVFALRFEQAVYCSVNHMIV